MKVAVSYLSSNDYQDCIRKINNTDADFIHADLCDGKYVENKNFSLKTITNILSSSLKALEIHLMVIDPLKYIDTLAILNIDTIYFHLDSTKSPSQVIDYLLSIGIKVGIALNPDDDDISLLSPYLDKIDKVLIMSVYPGKGGQAFLENTIYKIDKLNEFKNLYHFEVAIDGGINDETIHYLDNKNVDEVISGSFITNSDNYNAKINILKNFN